MVDDFVHVLVQQRESADSHDKQQHSLEKFEDRNQHEPDIMMSPGAHLLGLSQHHSQLSSERRVTRFGPNPCYFPCVE